MAAFKETAVHGDLTGVAGTAASVHSVGDSAGRWTARWQPRPALAVCVRLVALLAPLGAAALATYALTRTIVEPAWGWWLVGWFALVIGAPSLVLVVVGRAARRLLPIAALLRLTLVFPDRAPGRFSLALRAGTARHLEARITEAREAGDGDDPAAAARRILELLAALGDHDRLTRGHCERVRAFNDLLAVEMGLSADDRDRLRWAALLHDIGKLRVPTRILTKTTKPTISEWDQLRAHPIEGARLTAGLRSWLGPWADSIEQHHERWDGAGYPSGVAGRDICLGARIVAVADTFEVMTARRPYQRPVSPAAARAELARCAGSQFDPAVVRAFLTISIGDLHRALGLLSWLAELPFLSSMPRLEGVAAAAGRTAASLGVSTALAAGITPANPVTSTTAPASQPSRHPAHNMTPIAAPTGTGSPTPPAPPRPPPAPATPTSAPADPSSAVQPRPPTPVQPPETVSTEPATGSTPSTPTPAPSPPVPVTIPPVAGLLPLPAPTPTTPPPAPPAAPQTPPTPPPTTGLLGGVLGLVDRIVKGG